jgi:hypothetical protein
MNKHTATDRTGTVHTRNSANRVYTHTVVARPCYKSALEVAVSPGHQDESNFAYYAAYLDGTSRFLVKPAYRSEEAHAEQCEKDIARAREKIGEAKTVAEYVAMKRQARLAAVEEARVAGGYEIFGNLGWCGRLDLAQKLAAGASPYWTEVTILPVTMERGK